MDRKTAHGLAIVGGLGILAYLTRPRAPSGNGLVTVPADQTRTGNDFIIGGGEPTGLRNPTPVRQQSLNPGAVFNPNGDASGFNINDPANFVDQPAPAPAPSGFNFNDHPGIDAYFVDGTLVGVVPGSGFNIDGSP